MTSYSDGYNEVIKLAKTSMPRKMSEILWTDHHPAIRAAAGGGGAGGGAGGVIGGVLSDEYSNTRHDVLTGAVAGAGIGGLGGGAYRHYNPIKPHVDGSPGVFKDRKIGILSRTRNHDYHTIAGTGSGTRGPYPIETKGFPSWLNKNLPFNKHLPAEDKVGTNIRTSPVPDISHDELDKQFLGGSLLNGRHNPAVKSILEKDEDLRRRLSYISNEVHREKGNVPLSTGPVGHASRVYEDRLSESLPLPVRDIEVGWTGNIRNNPGSSPGENETRRLMRKLVRENPEEVNYVSKYDDVEIPGKLMQNIRDIGQLFKE